LADGTDETLAQGSERGENVGSRPVIADENACRESLIRLPEDRPFEAMLPRPMFCARCHRSFAEGVTECDRHGGPLVTELFAFIPTRPTEREGLLVADRFEIKGTIDEGGSGRVYLARDLVSERPVAVKIPDVPKAQRKATAARFLREAEVAKMIDHPNVVDTFFAGELPDGTPVIVMEYLFGETLGSRCRREGPLAVPVVLAIAREVAIALAAAHREAVFHRDVKPDNIFLVGEPGKHHHVKVVDFGLAKVRSEKRTSTGTTLGTVEFMAPEQCVADPSDARTDVYGLGAVMYRALTGVLPFEDKQIEMLLAKQLVDPPIPLRHLAPAVPAPVEKLVHACLRKDPAARPEGMSRIAEELDGLLVWMSAGGPVPEPVWSAPTEPDRYWPRGYASRLVAAALYRKLGRVPPDFNPPPSP
jgi:serine/threonine-protein kinase